MTGARPGPAAPPPPPPVLAYGDGFLVEHPLPLRLRAAVADRPGVEDAVPGDGTLLVRGPGARAALVAALGRRTLPREPGRGRTVVLDVRYDGPDLEAVPGLSADEVVALHTGARYTAAFGGFAPGFAYLRGLPPPLARLPRLPTPRERVPAGSVAVAGGWCGVYPTDSPGGWLLLGRTDATLFDPRRDPPSLLVPGTRVRFVAA